MALFLRSRECTFSENRVGRMDENGRAKCEAESATREWRCAP
jgi:hypothetical protein